MLAGPPRLVSLIPIALFLGLGWYYFRLVHTPLKSSTPSGLRIDTTPPPALGGFQSDGIDFSYPPKFKEGTPKEPGSNYSAVMVLGKTKKEDISWMHVDLADIPLKVYEVDNPDAENKIPKNKGREAMVRSPTLLLRRSSIFSVERC
jgi:hypothetical protein